MSVERQYKTRIGSTPRNFRARPGSNLENGEHQTSNAELRTSNQNGETASLPTTSSIASTEDDTLLSPRLSGEKNEERGFYQSQIAESRQSLHQNLNSTSSPPSSPPLHGGEGDGLARASALASEENRTSNPDRIGERSSQPEAHGDAATQNATLLSPRLSGERNEERGFYESQIAESRQSLHQNLNNTSSPRPSPPLPGGEGDGLAPARALASGEPRTSNPGSAPTEHNHVTRQELKRELDSLRRLIENRK